MNREIFEYLYGFALQSELFDTAVIFTAIFLGWFLVAWLLWTAVREFLTAPTSDARFVFFQKWGMVIFGSAALAWAVGEALNLLFPVARPFVVLDTITPLFFKGEYDAFPSGHATFFMALAAALYFHHRPMSTLFFAGALLIGLSRVIAGVHWPADILGGFILGGIANVFVYQFYKKHFSIIGNSNSESK